MALDPPLTQSEEDLILLVRSLQDKEVEVAEAADDERQAEASVRDGRADLVRLRREFAGQLRKRGIDNPEALMRARKP